MAAQRLYLVPGLIGADSHALTALGAVEQAKQSLRDEFWTHALAGDVIDTFATRFMTLTPIAIRPFSGRIRCVSSQMLENGRQAFRVCLHGS